MSNYQFTQIGPEIFLCQNLLDPALCQQVIEITEFHRLDTAGIELAQIDTTIRSNALLRLEGSSLLDSTNQLLLQKVEVIQRWLHQHYGVRFAHAETCSILRYREGEFYQRHVDNLLKPSRVQEANFGIPTRDISIVGYLNAGFEGGETFFDRQDIKVTPQQGHVLIFPSFFVYPHQSLAVLKGQKYAFTTWLYHCN